MNALQETDKAYLAGLIDGEGCITITKTQGKVNRTPVYTATVVIAMTNKNVLEYVKAMTGIGSMAIQDRSQRENYSDAYRWFITVTSDIRDLLLSIIPFLHVKKVEAESMVEFLSLPRPKLAGKGYITPPFYVQQRENYYLLLRDLKTAGKGLRDNTPRPEIAKIEDPQYALFSC